MYIKNQTFQCRIWTFFGHTVFLKLRIGQFSDTPTSPSPPRLQLSQLSFQNYLMFNAFGEGYVCLLKMLFLRICRLYFIQFLREVYMEKVLHELFGVLFLGAHLFKRCQNTSRCGTAFKDFFLIGIASTQMLKRHKAWSYKKKKCKKNKACRKSLQKKPKVVGVCT